MVALVCVGLGATVLALMNERKLIRPLILALIQAADPRRIRSQELMAFRAADADHPVCKYEKVDIEHNNPENGIRDKDPHTAK